MKSALLSLILTFFIPAALAQTATKTTATQKNPAAPSIVGTWAWTCCGAKHYGTFHITSASADGTFTGKFGSTPDDGNSPLSGSLRGDRIQFTRTMLENGKKMGEQQWQAKLVHSGGQIRMEEGVWSGYGSAGKNGSFAASKTR
jgi:hypothetical protein